MGLKKGPSAEDVQKKIEAGTATDKAAAAILKDEKELWSESAKKGAVKEHMKGVKESVAKVLADHPELEKKTANDLFNKEYGGEAGKGKGTAAIKPLVDSFKGTDEGVLIRAKADAAAAAILALPEGATEDEKEAAGKAAAKAVKKVPEADWTLTVATALASGALPTAPPALRAAVNDAGSREEAIAACNQFEKDWEVAEANSKAADDIAKYKETFLADMESIAVTAVHEQQKNAFEAARTQFTIQKAFELVPPPTEAELKLPAEATEQDKVDAMTKLTYARNQQRVLAIDYLAGLMSAAPLAVGGDHERGPIQVALQTQYETFKVATQQKFVNLVSLEVKDRPDKKTYKSDALKNATPAIRAHVEGLLDSYNYKDAAAEKGFVVWAQGRINSLPEKDRNDPDKVRKVLSTTHTEDNASSDWLETGKKTDDDKAAVKVSGEDDPKKDEKEKLSGQMDKAVAMMKAHPQVRTFLKQRMAMANDFFAGKPNHEKDMRRYRNMLLSSIGSIGDKKPVDVDMAGYMKKLNALPMPSTFEAGAMKVDRIPPGFHPAVGRLLPGTGPYAAKLMARLKKAKATKGTIIQFKYKTAIYYGKYTGKNLVIYTKGPAARGPQTTPKAPQPKDKKPKGPVKVAKYVPRGSGRGY